MRTNHSDRSGKDWINPLFFPLKKERRNGKNIFWVKGAHWSIRLWLLRKNSRSTLTGRRPASCWCPAPKQMTSYQPFLIVWLQQQQQTSTARRSCQQTEAANSRHWRPPQTMATTPLPMWTQQKPSSLTIMGEHSWDSAAVARAEAVAATMTTFLLLIQEVGSATQLRSTSSFGSLKSTVPCSRSSLLCFASTEVSYSVTVFNYYFSYSATVFNFGDVNLISTLLY